MEISSAIRFPGHKTNSFAIRIPSYFLLASGAVLTACAGTPVPASPGTPFVPATPSPPYHPEPPRTSLATRCGEPPELADYKNKVIRVGTHLGTRFDRQTLIKLRTEIDCANADNPAVLGGFVPITIIVDQDMLMNDSGILESEIFAMRELRFQPIIRVATVMKDPHTWVSPDENGAQKLGRKLHQVLSGMTFPEKIAIQPFNEPNIPQEFQGSPETFGRVLAAFRRGFGTMPNASLGYPALSFNPTAIPPETFLRRSLEGIAREGDFDFIILHSYEADYRQIEADLKRQLALYGKFRRFFSPGADVIITEFGPTINGDAAVCDHRWPKLIEPMIPPLDNPDVPAKWVTPVCIDTKGTHSPIITVKTGSTRLQDFHR